jgi:16S rRNA (guanine527-N7)-methyltransferase
MRVDDREWLDSLEEHWAAAAGANPESGQLERIAKFLELLRSWNRVHRLVGSDDRLWLVEHLVLDSLLFLKLLPVQGGKVMDLGSGAGFPGIPVAVARPDLRMTLVESRRHRASFLFTAVRELGLAQVSVVAERLDESAAGRHGRFEAVVARCSGNPDDVFAIAAGVLAAGGVAIVSGPPAQRPLARGEWRTVPSWRPGKSRLFAVWRPAGSTASA